MIPPPPIPLENASTPPPAAPAENPRPHREVSKFRDDYGVMWRYYSRFDFDLDPNFVYTKSKYYEDEDSEEDYEDDYVDEEEDPDNVRHTLIRYVNQIRKSFGFDVDCHPPRWFDANLTPIAVRPHGNLSPREYYISVLTPVIGRENAETKDIYTVKPYTEFSIMLTEAKADALAKQLGVLYVETVG